VEGGGDDQPDRADEFEDAEGHPAFLRQRTKGRDLLAYLVEHEDLHDARRSVQERGEDLPPALPQLGMPFETGATAAATNKFNQVFLKPAVKAGPVAALLVSTVR
jgi:hypothetical protein